MNTFSFNNFKWANLNQIKVPIRVEEKRGTRCTIDKLESPESFFVYISYSVSTTIQDLLDQIIQVSQRFDRPKTNGLRLRLHVTNIYQHRPTNQSITCPHLKPDSDDEKHVNVMQCPIYHAMFKQYSFTADNLKHLVEFDHFVNERDGKPVCRYNQNCKAYVRMENGGNALKDECHLKLFQHPPRGDRQIKMEYNMNQFVFHNKKNSKCYYMPSDAERARYRDSQGRCEYLIPLMEEVIANGYGRDLALTEEDHNNRKWTILKVVEEKLQHIRHKNIGAPLLRDGMLALILYTGCDCNYDLCTSQRNGDYDKWKWFDHCLFWAINSLSERERGNYKVYSGLKNVKLKQKQVTGAGFPTYTSTSWCKDVAVAFMQGKGMIIEMDATFVKDGRVGCCDVSWISKFPDEAEVLFSRTYSIYAWSDYALTVVDEQNGMQTVSLCGMRDFEKKQQSKKQYKFVNLFQNDKLSFGSGFLRQLNQKY
eukprot:593862_1